LDDLGGSQGTSTQQRQLADLAVKTKFILESIDGWILKQPSLVNAKKRTLLPIILQRQTLADSLARLMTQLGLERRPRPVQTLEDYTREKYGTRVPESAPDPPKASRET
jgi:hypothetical protein